MWSSSSNGTPVGNEARRFHTMGCGLLGCGLLPLTANAWLSEIFRYFNISVSNKIASLQEPPT